MRLHARDGHTGFTTYDAKRCMVIKNVRWVCEETATWAEIDVSPSGRSFANLFGDARETVRQEDRIKVYLARKLIVFNEVDIGDAETGASQELMARAAA